MRVVEAFGRQDLEAGRMTAASHATVTAALKARRIKSLLSPVVTIVVALCTGFVLWRGTTLIVAGAMTAGALTVFLAYLSKFFKPVQDLAKMTNTIAQTSVALERIQTILAADEMIPERADAVDPGTVQGEITFEHVAFGYGDVAPVLRDVNFTIKPGQVVGIVGPTGGGKSTVVSLIPRFYDPTAGPRADRRQRYPHAGSSCRCAARSASSCRRPCCSTARSARTSRTGGPTPPTRTSSPRRSSPTPTSSSSKMPHGYDSVVGERGDTLSGGQRQRIGIARALIRHSPILILDEPTAALDTESERLVIEGLQRLMKGRTVIMIAHRLSTIRDADKIIVLKDGVVAEQGSHDELMRRGGVYAELYHIQYGTPAARPAPAASRGLAPPFSWTARLPYVTIR